MNNGSQMVTVVIPTYNRKDQLRIAVNSVLDQSINELGIHIFDNCSTDGTEETVKELQARHSNIRYTRRPVNIGSKLNYAGAIASVETPFFIPLADDDWLLEGAIRILLDAIEEDRSLGFVAAQTRHQSESGEISRLNPSRPWEFRKYEPGEFLPIWVKLGHFEWSSLIFRTAARDAVGGIDTEVGLPFDLDFQLQILLRYPVRLIETPAAVFLLHPLQSSAEMKFTAVDQTASEGIMRLIKKAYSSAESLGHTRNSMKAIDHFSRSWISYLGRTIAENGDPADLVDFLKRIFSITGKPSLALAAIYGWSRKQVGLMIKAR
jgi:hypothetical protein